MVLPGLSDLCAHAFESTLSSGADCVQPMAQPCPLPEALRTPHGGVTSVVTHEDAFGTTVDSLACRGAWPMDQQWCPASSPGTRSPLRSQDPGDITPLCRVLRIGTLVFGSWIYGNQIGCRVLNAVSVSWFNRSSRMNSYQSTAARSGIPVGCPGARTRRVVRHRSRACATRRRKAVHVFGQVVPPRRRSVPSRRPLALPRGEILA